MGGVEHALSGTVLDELAHRLGLPSAPQVLARWTGATSTVLRWGDELTVKVPHAEADAVRACLRHAEVSAAARRLGVVCPEVVGVVDLHPLFDQPLVVSRFIPGHQLAPSDVIPRVWAGVGNQLRRLHAATLEQTPIGLRVFVQTAGVDLDVLTGRLRAGGRVSTEQARQLYDLREALVRHVVGRDRLVLCHGDIHAGNVIAHDGQLEGLVDLAGAGWLDAAWDFVGVPAAAVPLMLEGCRWNASPDDTLLERVTWCRLQVALHRALGSARPVHDIARALADAAHLLR